MAEVIARAEAVSQLEAAAQAAAEAEEAAAAEAELAFETLSESALIEAELIEEFANMDPTLDTEALNVILQEADLTQDMTNLLEEELVDTQQAAQHVSRMVPPEVRETAQTDLTTSIEESDALMMATLDGVDSIAGTDAVTDFSDLVKLDGAEVEDTLVPEREELISNSELDEEVQGQEVEDQEVEGQSADTSNEMIEQPSSDELLTMAELYDSAELDLDETNSVGFGGVPTAAVSSKPRGHFFRLWAAVRKATRNLIDLPLAWIRKRRK